MIGRKPKTELVVAVEHRDALWARIADLAQAGMPKALREFIAGPASRLNVAFAGGRFEMRNVRRSIDVNVANDLLLRTTLKIPRAARSSIASAVRLHAVEETPFKEGELLCHVAVASDPDDPEMLDCRITYVPRSYLDRALSESGVKTSWLRAMIAPTDDGRRIDLLRCYAPAVANRRRRAVQRPILLLVASLAGSLAFLLLGANADLAQRHARLDLFENSIGTLARAIGSAKTANEEQRAILEAMPGEDRSVTAWLGALGNALPPTATATRIALAGRTLEVSLTSPHLLADVQALSAALAIYKIELTGTVASTSGTSETGAIRLSAVDPVAPQ